VSVMCRYLWVCTVQVFVGLYCAGICGSVLCRYFWVCTVQVFLGLYCAGICLVG